MFIRNAKRKFMFPSPFLKEQISFNENVNRSKIIFIKIKCYFFNWSYLYKQLLPEG